MIFLTAILVAANRRPEPVLATFKEEVEYIAWTPRHTLVAVTQDSVTELQSGRSHPLRRFTGALADPIRRSPHHLQLNASRTKAIGDGFVLDLRSLATRPLARAAAWDGDRLVEIDSPSRGRYRMFRSGRAVPLAPGWFVLGVSDDLRLALACQEEPFTDIPTFLLQLDRLTGAARALASYNASSDDHHWLGMVQENGPSGARLLHSIDLAADLTTAYLAKQSLRKIDLNRRRQPLPDSLFQTSALAEWIHPASPWALVSRTFVLDKEAGFDATTLDLWNSRTGAMIRLAKATDYWAGTETRGSGPKIEAYALDWPTRRLGYVVSSRNASRVCVARFAL